MNLKDRLSLRIGMDDIHDITYLTQGDNVRKQELYDLLFDQDDRLAYQAAWIMTHFSVKENEWLHNKQNELIDEVLVCTHTGKRRLILALLYKQPTVSPPRVDLLNFCLDHMLSKKEPFGVQSLCIKLAYKLCRPIPELTQELKRTLEMMEDTLSPAIQIAKKNILKDISRDEVKNSSYS